MLSYISYKILIYLIESTDENPLSTYKILKQEILKYNPDLILKPSLVCRSKMDLIWDNRVTWQGFSSKVYDISAITGAGIDLLISRITELLHENK